MISNIPDNMQESDSKEPGVNIKPRGVYFSDQSSIPFPELFAHNTHIMTRNVQFATKKVYFSEDLASFPF